MKCFVSGGAGFIGSHLIDRLMAENHEVIVYDNLSLGSKEKIEHHLDKKNFKFIESDLLDLEKLKHAMTGADIVFHLAANSDISNNDVTNIDLKQGTIVTYNVLESMRFNNIKKIVFSSTSAIYGEADIKPTPENYGPLLPISFYGASKLACEGLISSFCHNFNFQAWMFRFANIIGSRGSHGILPDFVKKLNENPKELEILGDGSQKKPYLEVKNCVDGILFGWKNSNKQINYFNLGCIGATDVVTIADTIVQELGLKNVKYNFTGGKRGWPGDVAEVAFDVSKINRLGWKARYTSDEAVRAGARDFIKEQEK